MRRPESAPESVCILRLSALGDACHVVPLLRTLQAAWPTTRFTWVIGRAEARLLGVIPDVEFVEVDKKGGVTALAALRKQLRGRRFDLLLHLQHSLRASIVSRCIPARRRIGFHRSEARELQWLFTNETIAPVGRVHVLDSLLAFADHLGVSTRATDWRLPLPAAAIERARRLSPPAQRTLLISPSSSHPLRNWSPERYAAVADYAQRRQGMRVYLCGGPSAAEREMADAILARAKTGPGDLVGQDTLPELLALLERATALVSPDSGPVHMATLVNTPVIGLYAATPTARSGPWRSRDTCVDRYEEAARRFLNTPAERIPWTKKIEQPGVMDLVGVDDVTWELDRLMAKSEVNRRAA